MASPSEPPRIYAVGDIHGDVDRLEALLRAAGLLNGDIWSGGESRLIFTGDLTDRGDQGLAVIDLIRGFRKARRAASSRLWATTTP